MNKPVFDSVFDLGTSPHGLSADLRRTQEEAREVDDLLSLEDGFALAERRPQRGTSEDAAPAKPEIYRSVSLRSACRRVREAAAKLFKGNHTLRMDDFEFLHVVSAVERDRSRTRKAVSKGLADYTDLRATDSLWQKLQILRAVRMKNSGAVR